GSPAEHCRHYREHARQVARAPSPAYQPGPNATAGRAPSLFPPKLPLPERSEGPTPLLATPLSRRLAPAACASAASPRATHAPRLPRTQDRAAGTRVVPARPAPAIPTSSL